MTRQFSSIWFWFSVLALAILAVFLGLWEIGAEAGIIDPFFFSSPSGIWDQTWSWITEGTSQ